MSINKDVIIIGAGVAGLSTAINISIRRPDLSIAILVKTHDTESNTSFAQGGIASVWNFDNDSFDKHINDTLIAGDGLCNPIVVDFIIKEGYSRVKDLIEWGANFDRIGDENSEYDLGKEGGHSENRILHFKDITGQEIQRTLLKKIKEYPNIQLFEHFFAIDIITQHHLGYNINRVSPNITCYGAYALDRISNKIVTFLSKSTVLATGGIGQIYKSTTNPAVATGDGIAMFYRAKGRVQNMEFVQFHPTALYHPTGGSTDFLISEAVRGYGAILKSTDGKEFMHKYDSRLSLAPRDIVARAIDNEMKIRGDDYVFLDCTHLDPQGFEKHFPNIKERCLSVGINPLIDFIPVMPTCHYSCGGIVVDKNGHSSILQLYAAGECTDSGLHGANRLASNSLLEGLVFGKRVADDIVDQIDTKFFQKNIPEWDAAGTNDPKEMVLITQSRKELREIMSSYVGIVRSNVRLKRALERTYLLHKETEELYHNTTISPQLCELRNMITIGYLTVRCASMRHESRGLHYTTDYPQKLPFLEQSLL